jgi:hypothetical protein
MSVLCMKTLKDATHWLIDTASPSATKPTNTSERLGRDGKLLHPATKRSLPPLSISNLTHARAHSQLRFALTQRTCCLAALRSAQREWHQTADSKPQREHVQQS